MSRNLVLSRRARLLPSRKLEGHASAQPQFGASGDAPSECKLALQTGFLQRPYPKDFGLTKESITQRTPERFRRRRFVTSDNTDKGHRRVLGLPDSRDGRNRKVHRHPQVPPTRMAGQSSKHWLGAPNR